MSRRSNRDAEFMSDERLDQGYVVILPGIEGRSLFNRSIRKGLVDAGVPYGIEIHDWTSGPLWLLWNICDRRRHLDQARVIARKILSYRESRPTRPIYLVGHSGGGAMIAFTLEALPEDVTVTGGILIVPALSPVYDLTAALSRTERGLWNFSSYGDVFLVGAGTTLVGTMDRRHRPSAGMLGFSKDATPGSDSGVEGSSPPLREVRYKCHMAKQWNLGGHLSCINPRFVREWIAPILLGSNEPP